MKAETLNTAKKIAENAKKIGVILLAISIGFVIGHVHYRLTEKPEVVSSLEGKNVHRLKETSVAINERDEVLIINRNDGTYEIYEDSIGKAIFRMYANQMANGVK
jgi:hypothetical protein